LISGNVSSADLNWFVYFKYSELFIKLWINNINLWISEKGHKSYPQSMFFIPRISSLICTESEAKLVIFSTACITVV
jgi:hypothetical protein